MKQIIFIILISILLFSCKEEKKLPIYGKEIIKTEQGESTVIKPMMPFEALDQKGEVVTNQTFKNKVIVVDFFFTSCPSICPVMTKNMLLVKDTYDDRDDIKYVSFSIDPKRDTIEKLDRYANKIGIETNDDWHFVRAEQDSIYKWAKELMVVAFQDDSIPGGFEHSGYLILIDKNQHIRGYYDGTKDEDTQTLISDLEILFREQP